MITILDRMVEDSDRLRTICGDCSSILEALEILDVYPSSTAYRSLRRACEMLDIPLPWNQGGGWNHIDDEDFFVSDPNVWRQGILIKEHLLAAGVADECVLCGCSGEWNGRPISTQVDHIDGDHFNNLRSNLRLLCPNCHSQTETYKGGNKVSTIITDLNCVVCDVSTGTPYRLYCDLHRRAGRYSLPRLDATGKLRVVEWPEDNDLVLLVEETSLTGAGKVIGVSATAVSKRLKRAGLR